MKKKKNIFWYKNETSIAFSLNMRNGKKFVLPFRVEVEFENFLGKSGKKHFLLSQQIYFEMAFLHELWQICKTIL